MFIVDLQRILKSPLDEVTSLDGWVVTAEAYHPTLGQLYFSIKDFGISYESGEITLFMTYDED